MATNLQTAVCHTQMGAVATAAGATAYLMIWTGTGPAKAGGAYVAPTGTLLATIPCANPIGTDTNGVLTFTAAGMTVSSGVVAGTPGYFRLNTSSTDSAGAGVIAQGSAGTSASDINFVSIFASGGTVTISSLTITSGSVA